MSIETPENFHPSKTESPISPKDLENYLNDYSKVMGVQKQEPTDPQVREMLANYRVVCGNGVVVGIAKTRKEVGELAAQCRES